MEMSTAKRITFSGNQVIEDRKVVLAQAPCNTEQPIWAEPEIEGCKVIDGRVNEQDVTGQRTHLCSIPFPVPLFDNGRGFDGVTMNKAKFFQYCVIALTVAGLAWGLVSIWSVLNPGPSGEWAGLAVVAAAVIDIPAGLIALAVALSIRSGSAGLRRVGIVGSIIVLSLPVIASLLWANRVWLASVKRSFQ
jgi:hypothetical protein